MPTETHLQTLVTARLGGDLTAYVDRRRARDCSWRRIAHDIARDTDIILSHETLRSWFVATPVDPAA